MAVVHPLAVVDRISVDFAAQPRSCPFPTLRRMADVSVSLECFSVVKAGPGPMRGLLGAYPLY